MRSRPTARWHRPPSTTTRWPPGASTMARASRASIRCGWPVVKPGLGSSCRRAFGGRPPPASAIPPWPTPGSSSWWWPHRLPGLRQGTRPSCRWVSKVCGSGRARRRTRSCTVALGCVLAQPTPAIAWLATLSSSTSMAGRSSKPAGSGCKGRSAAAPISTAASSRWSGTRPDGRRPTPRGPVPDGGSSWRERAR